MEYFTAALCVAVCILISTKYSTIMKLVQRQLHLYKLASKFKGPKGLPIIGNAHLFTGNTEEIMATFYELGKSYPTPFPIWMGHLHVFFALATPEQIKVACLSSKTINKSMIYDFLDVMFGTGVFTATAAKWRVHRKLIVPTFHPKILQTFVEVFASRSAEMTARMEQNLHGPEFQPLHYLSQYATTTVCQTTMGVNLDGTVNCREFSESIENVLDSVVKRTVRPWMYPNFIFDRTQLGRHQKKNGEFFNTFTDNVIQKKKKEILERGNQFNLDAEVNDDCLAMPRRQVFLDHFLNPSGDSKVLSDRELRDEVNTLIIAGSDTTSVVSAFVMLMLASHPEVQEKVYEELCEIHGDHDGDDLNITGEHLKRMTYLERVIKETMRLFPIIPYFSRSVAEDLIIGGKYAMLSMKTLIATIIWKFILRKDNIVPVQDIRLKMELVLRTVDPITLRIEQRKRKVKFVGISCT